MAGNVVQDAQHTDLHAHPSQETYVKIAAFLGIITAIEVAIYYIDFFHTNNLLVPALLIFSAIKFVTVVAFFMHLKFDKRMLAWMFGAAMVVSLAVFIGTWFVMHYDQASQVIGDMSI